MLIAYSPPPLGDMRDIVCSLSSSKVYRSSRRPSYLTRHPRRHLRAPRKQSSTGGQGLASRPSPECFPATFKNERSSPGAIQHPREYAALFLMYSELASFDRVTGGFPLHALVYSSVFGLPVGVNTCNQGVKIQNSTSMKKSK